MLAFALILASLRFTSDGSDKFVPKNVPAGDVVYQVADSLWNVPSGCAVPDALALFPLWRESRSKGARRQLAEIAERQECGEHPVRFVRFTIAYELYFGLGDGKRAQRVAAKAAEAWFTELVHLETRDWIALRCPPSGEPGVLRCGSMTVRGIETQPWRELALGQALAWLEKSGASHASVMMRKRQLSEWMSGKQYGPLPERPVPKHLSTP